MNDILDDLMDLTKFTRRKTNNKLRMAAAAEIKKLRRQLADRPHSKSQQKRIQVQKGTAADIKRNLNISDDDFSSDKRCKGKTQKGTRCRRLGTFMSGYCVDHYNQKAHSSTR